MKAACIAPGETVSLRDVPLPEIPEGGALIRVRACGVCGSDVDKLVHRRAPEGTVLGHEVVGEIAELTPEARQAFPQLEVGQRVALAHHVPCGQCRYCLSQSQSMCRTFKATNIHPGGFGEWISVSAGHLAHTVFPLSAHVPDAAGACIEPLACCLRAVHRLPAWAGKDALVVGLGFIGLLTAAALAEHGYMPIGLDIDPLRASWAAENGFLPIGHAFSQADTALQVVKARTETVGADVVFLTVVNPATLATAMAAIRDGGVLVLFTSSDAEAPLIDQNALYFREITVLTSYSPSLDALQESHRLIEAGRIPVERLVTKTCTLETLDKGIAAYRRGEALKVLMLGTPDAQ